MKQTVYVLTLSYAMDDGSEETEVLGVYSNLELAQKMMNNLGDRDIEYRKNDLGIDEDNIDDLVIDKSDMCYYIYLDGWYDSYYECLFITEKIIDFDVNY